MSFTLRPYQREAIDAVFADWSARTGRPTIVLGTGGGKTSIFSSLIAEFRKPDPDASADRPVPKWMTLGAPGARVVVLVHRDELADQALSRIRSALPAGTRIGKVKASSNAVGADVMVCSVQTLARTKRLDQLIRAQDRYGKIGAVISDECHLAGSGKPFTEDGSHRSSWMRVLDAMPEAKMLGVTATLGRGDGKGLGDVWDKVAYTMSTQKLTEAGYLVPVDALQVAWDIDVSAVRTRAGDFVESDLGKAALAADIQHAVAKAYLEHAGDRPGLVFTPDVATAEAAAQGLNDAGIPTAVVAGSTPRSERQKIYRDFEAGRIRMLANCQVLTTGADFPWASVAILARHTKSRPLYSQMVGRILRLHPDKERALLIDLTNGSADHNLHPIVDLRKVKNRKDEGETCTCDPCETCEKCPLHRECRICDSCAMYGGCDACPVCAEKQDRAACEGCGRCKFTGIEASNKFAEETKWLDLFRFEDGAEKSAYVWGKTEKGVHYISVQGGYVFLWPGEGPDHYDVCDTFTEPGKWHKTDQVGLPLKAAMKEAERKARFVGVSSRKKSPWRAQDVTAKQVWMASRKGIDAAGMTRGELSEAIDHVEASAVFDRYRP